MNLKGIGNPNKKLTHKELEIEKKWTHKELKTLIKNEPIKNWKP